MKKYLITGLLIATGSSFATQTVSLDGNYHCKGHEVDTKTAFTCEMTVKKAGETYSSIATCDDGTAYHGTSIYDEKAHLLSTAFINIKNPAEVGVSISYLKEDGSMSSNWSYVDKTTIAQTFCSKKG